MVCFSLWWKQLLNVKPNQIPNITAPKKTKRAKYKRYKSILNTFIVTGLKDNQKLIYVQRFFKSKRKKHTILFVFSTSKQKIEKKFVLDVAKYDVMPYITSNNRFF